MSIPSRLIVAFIAVAGVLPAQSSREKERVRQEVLEKQRAMREGKVVRTNVRVTIRLDNGSRMRGVVRHGRFVERVDGLTFVPSDVQTPGAGLRLWYYDGTNSYIFLPYVVIKSHKIGERLTDEEVSAIAERFRQESERVRQRAEEKRRQLQQQQQQQQAQAAQGQDSLGATKLEAIIELTPDELALLKEFPPEEGWGPDRISEIERKRVVLGVYPDQKSQRFVQKFEEWNAAFSRREKREQQIKQREELEQAQQQQEQAGAQTQPAPGNKTTKPDQPIKR